MLKALFLDLDETLCDTSGANEKALDVMADKVTTLFKGGVDERAFVAHYLKGIYRELDERYAQALLPVEDEGAFRLALIEMILQDLGIEQVQTESAAVLQQSFDRARFEFFDFFPGIKQMLLDFRQRFTLVVITNGPEFSQVAKVNAVQLREYVDHVIIGGQEPEEKPAVSIFEKALGLAACEASEAIHIGDSLKADITGANNAGIESIWVSHNQGLPISTEAKPDHVIPTPLHIRGLVEKIASH
jgi:HAD superfamily hydrolase (TIGR01549 family)